MRLSTFDTFKTLSGSNKGLKHLSGGELKKLQDVLLGIIKDIDVVCKKYGINYILAGGSCLGAVRHNGFIPWDDDLDICMPRRDYEKFKKVFQKELGEKYWLHTLEYMNKMGLDFVRARKKGTVLRSRDDLVKTKEAGIYIDIFIIENTYDVWLMRNLQGFLSMAAGFLLSCRNFFKNRKFYLDLAKDDKKARRQFKVKIVLGFFTAWMSVERWAKIWDGVNRMCKNEKSKYIVIPAGRKHFFHEMYKRDEYCKSIRHKFEDAELPIPVGYDGYMKNMYGDYMKIPEKAKRETHVFLELDFGKE